MKEEVTPKKYTDQLIQRFVDNQNPEIAEKMEWYLKYQFKFYGIKNPERKALLKEFYAENGYPEESQLKEVIRLMWKNPQRELQYSAIELMEKKIKILDESWLELVEEMVLDKSWWDSVDGLSTRVAGRIFQKYPEQIKPWTEKWMASGNMWLQRISILFQLKYKTETDTKLLSKYILQVNDSNEFFLQKVIGWVLREYSKTNPKWVIDFCDKNDLKPLSRREALRLLK